MKWDVYEPILTKSRWCLLKRRPADSAEEAKTTCFRPEKAGSKKSLEFSFPAPCNLFSPGLSFQVLRMNHCDSSTPRFFSEKGSY